MNPVGTFELFKIGIGPSSSHTVGPMVAARTFALGLADAGIVPARIVVELYGSLGATGRGHGSDRAVLLGLEGEAPATVDVDGIEARMAAFAAGGGVRLPGGERIRFDPAADIVMHRRRSLPAHPNAMRFAALDGDGGVLRERHYYSIGGGFVVDEDRVVDGRIVANEAELAAAPAVPHPFTSGDDLLRISAADGLDIAGIMRANELVTRTADELRAGLLELRDVMSACIERGCRTRGTLPGGMRVPRRAPDLFDALVAEEPEEPVAAGEGAPLVGAGPVDPLRTMDWLNLFALAVNEENAAGGRVVTAPTNGAAGIIPAVLHWWLRFVPGADDDGVERFLLTAAAIGALYKRNASISGAEVGCQGEVGSACSMAAGALAAVLGGTPMQVENAAEIAMEHNLGLTCDPVGGLVQVPCIERNAMAAVKAVNAARLALRGDGTHRVSLDRVIRTMRDTGADMKTKYKETSRGGLALHFMEVSVGLPDC